MIKEGTSIVFLTADPLNRSVYLKEETLKNHIVGGDNQRPEVTPEIIKSTIENPAYIINDPIKDRERYYSLDYSPYLGKLKSFQVIVEHSKDSGDVVTAMYKTSIGSETGEIIYDAKNKLW